MAIVFALPHLFDAVVATFAADGTAAVQSFGWKASAEQIRGDRRITWRPGNESGDLGAMAPPKWIGKNPRQIATLNELCTVDLYAFDRAAANVERAQYQVAHELYDAWIRALELAAAGTYAIVSSKWLDPDRTRGAGVTIRAVLTIQAPITDTPYPTAPVDTGADLTLAELDHSEPQHVPPLA